MLLTPDIVSELKLFGHIYVLVLVFYLTASHPWSANIVSGLRESTEHPNNIAKALKAEGTFSSVHMWAKFVFIVHNVTVKFCWCSCCRQCYQMKHPRLTHKEPVPKMCRKIVFHTYCQVCACICMFVIMAALWNRAGHYIFALWFRSFFYLFFPCLISVVRDWMSTILAHMVWP